MLTSSIFTSPWDSSFLAKWWWSRRLSTPGDAHKASIFIMSTTHIVIGLPSQEIPTAQCWFVADHNSWSNLHYCVAKYRPLDFNQYWVPRMMRERERNYSIETCKYWSTDTIKFYLVSTPCNHDNFIYNYINSKITAVPHCVHTIYLESSTRSECRSDN